MSISSEASKSVDEVGSRAGFCRCSAAAPWQILTSSITLAEIVGLPPEELVEMPLSGLVPEEDRATVEAFLLSVAATRQPMQVCHRIAGRSGDASWVCTELRLVPAHGSGISSLELVVTEIERHLRLEKDADEAEASALAAEGRLAQVLESTSDCVFTLDRNWRFTFLNGRAQEELGSSEDLVGKRLLDAFPRLRETPAPAAYEEVMELREPRSFETFVPGLNSWYQVYAAPISDGITVFFRNIDAWIQAQQAILEQSEALQKRLNNIPQMVWSTRPDGYHDYFNQAWYDYTGVPPGSTDGEGWNGIFHPDDQERAWSVWKRCLLSGERYQIEYRLRHKSGEYRWVLGEALPERDDTGKIVRWYGTCTDIHERMLAREALRESEALNRSILDGSPDCMKLMDEHGTILFVNRLGPAALGIEDPASVLGTCWFDLLDERSARCARDAINNALTGETQRFTTEQQTVTGKTRWFDIIVAPVQPLSEQRKVLVLSRDVTTQKALEETLRESEEHYRYTVELSPQVPWTADRHGKCTDMGPRWMDLMGMTREECLQDGWTLALHPEDAPAVHERWQRSVSTGEGFDMRYRLCLRDGSYRWFRARAGARRDDVGNVIKWYGLAEDIHEQVTMETLLAQAEERYRLATRATNDLVWDWEIASGVVLWNDAVVGRFGYSTDQLKQSLAWWESKLHPADRERVVRDIMTAIGRAEDQFTTEYRFERADGTYAWVYDRGYIVRDESGDAIRAVGAMQDQSARKGAEERVLWSATHDSLTHLPNRSLFTDRLAEALAAAKSTSGRVGLLHLDVDHFKQVNDTFGHDAGDELLKTFAERLRRAVRSSDMVARLGGDEFAVILPDLSSNADVHGIVESLLERMREPFTFAGRILDCRASIGASVYPDHGTTSEELLKNADIALYAAKAAGRGGLQVFAAPMRADLQKRRSMISVARTALEGGQIQPYYQPKLDMRTRSIQGFEALLRWRHPTRGIQPPSGIAAAFEDLDLAAEMSDCMARQVMDDMRRWLDQGVDFDHVALNASAAEFRRDDFAERLLKLLQIRGIPARYLQLEVTETVFLGRGAEYVDRALKTLDRAGVSIALDDFGTGYASLRHLKKFPVSTIKIDRSFVQGIEEGQGDEQIIGAVINLGRSLGMKVVAEGIESIGQELYLRHLGCTIGQGYLYSKAMPARRVPAFLRDLCNEPAAEAA